MRILLDECLDEELRHSFSSHDCQTCRYAGLRGLTNGKLIAAAEQLGFEVLLKSTVDQNIPYQQSLKGRRFSIVILRSRTTTLEDMLPLVPQVLTSLKFMQPGDIVRIGLS